MPAMLQVFISSLQWQQKIYTYQQHCGNGILTPFPQRTIDE